MPCQVVRTAFGASWSGGVESYSVAGGEFFVGLSSEFEFADAGGPYAEVVGGCRQGEVLGASRWS